MSEDNVIISCCSGPSGFNGENVVCSLTGTPSLTGSHHSHAENFPESTGPSGYTGEKVDSSSTGCP